MKFADWIDEVGSTNIAYHLGVSVSTILYWKRGIATPRVETMMKLVKFSKGKLTVEDIVRAKKLKK